MTDKYHTIVADPPWAYPGASPPWRSSVEAHYPLMPLDEIADLPVDGLAAKDAHLYLWAVLPMMEDAFYIARAWRFRPSTVLTWCKPGPGLGGGYRGNTEHLIVARRGNAPFKTTGLGTWYPAQRGEHSQKPDLFGDMIEAMSPGPYLELFARRQRLGWDTWGNEALEHITLEASA